MKNRNRLAGLQSHFIKLPSDILDVGLDPTSICVYLTLVSFTEEFNPTLQDIASRSGIHKNTVCKAMRRLCLANVITKVKQGHVSRIPGSQTAMSVSCQSEYQFNSPKDWRRFEKPTKVNTVSKPLTGNLGVSDGND